MFKKAILIFFFLLSLFLICPELAPGCGPGQPARFWQVYFKLEIKGQGHDDSGSYPSGNFFLEIDWLGFLEEDGLDFIIYHLSTFPSHWDVSARKGSEPEVSLTSRIPAPEFKLDYVEGKEKEFIFYFSLNPSVITYSFDTRSGGIKMALPSLPWPKNQAEDSKLHKKIMGSRVLSISRSLLNHEEFKQNFNWTEEITWSDPGPINEKQKNEVKISVRMIKCQLSPNLRPGDGIGRKPVSTFRG